MMYNKFQTVQTKRQRGEKKRHMVHINEIEATQLGWGDGILLEKKIDGNQLTISPLKIQ